MTSNEAAGCVLGYAETLRRLEMGDIFQPGTWSHDNLRAAAYDLRVADDFLIIPAIKGDGGRRYNRGEKRLDPVVLRPGDVAFISTAERLCMPWDLSANIGIKFGYARKGILVLTGLLVDPGFGLQLVDGQWSPRPDERIHFLLANVGPNEVVLTPGKDKIASIQFLTVAGEVQKKEVPSTIDMQHEFFDPESSPELGLQFFSHMAELSRVVEEFNQRIHAVEGGTHQVVMFGVYLVCASVVVGSLTTLLAMMSSDYLTDRINIICQKLPSVWPNVCAFAIAAILSGFVIGRMFSFISGIITAFIIRRP